MAIVLDLTHTITPGMPVYPGTAPPSIREATTVDGDGFAEKLVTFYTHTGTHVDAPAHMLDGAATLDMYPASCFFGLACVVDVSGCRTIDVAIVEAHASLLDGCDFVLLHTGWCRYWGLDQYFSGFPVLTPGAARRLANSGLKGVGVDAISIDPVGTTTYENHLELLGAGLLSIENLTGLEALIGRRFTLACLPLKLERADGAPVRAVAILDA